VQKHISPYHHACRVNAIRTLMEARISPLPVAFALPMPCPHDDMVQGVWHTVDTCQDSTLHRACMRAACSRPLCM
jgi:hypothetical protein